MVSLHHDLKIAVRMLLASPSFTVVAVLTLALGIGGNTAIFSVVHSLVLGQLPFADSSRLVMVWQTDELEGNKSGKVAPANYLDWRNQNQVFEDISSWGSVTHNLTGAAEPRQLIGARVTSNFFDVLGVAPVLGRTFSPDDDRADAEKTVILSHELWRGAFDGDVTLIGNSIRLNDVPHTVLGVLADGGAFPSGREYFVPLAFDDEEAGYREWKYLQSMARLKEGVSLSHAQAEMDLLADRLTATYPETNLDSGIDLVPLREQLVGNFRPAALMLLAAVGLVLLIACANVANLLLVRGAARRRELGIRCALGAGRMRLVRQLLAESLVLSLVGGGLGILIANWGIDLLAATYAETMSSVFRDRIALNLPVMMFALTLSVITGLIFGLLPALSASRVDLNVVMKDQDHAASFSGRLLSLKSALVIGEIAISLVLLIGASLFTQSLQRLIHSDTGFDQSEVLSMRLTLPTPKYEESSLRVAFFQETLQRIRALPEVDQASAVLSLPFSGNGMSLSFLVEGRPTPDPSEIPIADYENVTPGYFETMRIPLIQGRFFDDGDDAKSSNVIIISQSMAEEYWPQEESIGQRISTGEGTTEEEWMEIVGVVGDIMHLNLGEDISPRMYTPYSQTPRFSMSVVVRTSRELLTAGPIRDIVRGIDPDQPVVDVRMMDEVVRAETMLPRMTATMTGGFAVVALLLAAIGLYGVMSFGVSQRTREIGIRMALGASRSSVITQFIRQGLILTLVGVGIGLISSIGLMRLIASQLYDVSPHDPMPFIVMTITISLVAILACFIPARRATGVDPMIALRYE